MSVTFFADSGEIMVGARVACYTYGRFNVILPEGKELAIDDYDTGYSDGYIYRPPEHTEFDDFDFAFVQADIEVDVNALWSDFEAVIDEAQKKVAEDVYFDADIEGTGLGRYKFGKHYKVGDIVRVGILGGRRYITAPVTQVTHLPSGELRVHVGGQAIRDLGLAEEQNRQVRQAIAKASAQNRQQLSKVSATAAEAIGKAGSALAAASVAVVQSGVEYAVSDSETTPPVSGWSATAPTRTDGAFIWQRMIVTYGDGRTERTEPVLVTGNTGADGLPGKDGTKLVKTVITYAVSSSGVTAPSSGWVSSPPAASAGQFVWTRSVWTYSDGTSETGYSVGKIGNTGATGAQGISITSVTRFWQWAASKPAVPTGTATPSGWSTTQPAYVMGQTLWTTTRTVMSNNTATWTPVSEEASVSAATAISAESANNRNRIWYSTADPGTTKGERPGDTWYKYSGSSIIGMWRWTGSAWVAESIAHQAIASVDAGKISTGILNAQRIGAGTIDATKLTITPGNLFPDPHFKDPSWSGVANVTTGTNNGGVLRITATGSHLGRYYQPSGLTDKSMTLEAGATYRLTAGVYMQSTISPKNVAVYMHYLHTDGSVKIQFLGNLVGVSGRTVAALNFTTPSAMKDGTCTLGFYLEAANAAGQGYVEVWDVQLTRAADSLLIVDGAIQAHHIAANTLTADMVKAGEIIVGDQGESVVNQIDELDSRLGVVADDLNTMKNLMEEYTSKETGFGYKSASGTVTGSANTLNYFEGESKSLTAKGNWVGRFTFLSFEHGNASLFEVGANRAFSVPGKALFWWEKDPLKITTSTKKLASVFEPEQSTWTNLPGFRWTAPAGATRITWSLKIEFTNVHRGSTYGIRVMQGTRVLYTYQTNNFGPLTALGNPTWYMSRSGETTLSGTSPVTLQVYCTNATSSKRRVTTTTNMTAKIVSPT